MQDAAVAFTENAVVVSHALICCCAGRFSAESVPEQGPDGLLIEVDYSRLMGLWGRFHNAPSDEDYVAANRQAPTHKINIHPAKPEQFTTTHTRERREMPQHPELGSPGV